MPATETKVVRSVCPFDCPDTCSLHVKMEDGVITSIDGNSEHPVTQGAICNKVRHLNERVYHPDRLMHPMRRVGPKGSLAFERISWDEAYDEITRRLKDKITEKGAESILPYSFYGNMGILNAEGMDRRFFHRLGASQLERTICNAAGSAGYRYTMGAAAGIDPEDTVHSKYVLVWGCNLVSTNMHQVMYLTEARKRGAKIVHIDVHRNRTSAWADEFIGILPGTDTALALGMMHVLIKEGLTDAEFIANHTKGYDELIAQAESYPPEKVSQITGIPADVIVGLAREYGNASPSFIRIGNGLQHHDNGGMAVRAIACLPALTGQWGILGGGAIKGNGYYSAVNSYKLERPDLMPDRNVRSINMNRLGEALLTAEPSVDILFVYNSNPAVVAPDQNQVRQGLMRDDLFTVVHDLFLTDTCQYADLVLPATSHFENRDLFASYWHLYLQLHEPIIEPMGECKSNFTLFKELGMRMGFEAETFDITEEQMIRQALDRSTPYLDGLAYEDLERDGWAKMKLNKPSMFPDKIPTPSGKIEFYSAAMLKAGLPPVPEYVPIHEPEELPFLLVTGPNHSFINSTFGNQDRLKRLEKQPTADMNAEDAASHRLQNGDKVRIWNERGECRIAVKVANNVLPGVLVTQGLWWEHGNEGVQAVNSLTSQRLSDMGGGATFFSTRVDMEKIE
ncbi:molybdopterin-containing oxidoreductase family protein [Cohnella luojiensis]|uniref:Molybdopterin oxidoreductase family protein n=1 Tax=Cohnella luojiensis TaxID=652876 RepID=A0A4Y8LRD6_9BACL|nr:molybdopterin oxidoreductase family protein [Cohnella luojiensis]TFE23387.1 molybdopterin oxidoreductase family protein [Cohnella luojiensis]